MPASTSVFAMTHESIPVNAPLITQAAREYVNQTLDAGWLSSAGPMVERFERAFAQAIGVRHAVSCNSGTSALHLALAALGIGPGDEVIVPDFTMIASACAVLYTGATPVFVDVEADICTLDPNLVAAAITPRTRAILAVHIYGHSADMDALAALADARGLWLVEDAAEAHGARYRGRACGALGDIAAFSFYGNKIISTGEGGMLTTDDDAIWRRGRARCATWRIGPDSASPTTNSATAIAWAAWPRRWAWASCSIWMSFWRTSAGWRRLTVSDSARSTD